MKYLITAWCGGGGWAVALWHRSCSLYRAELRRFVPHASPMADGLRRTRRAAHSRLIPDPARAWRSPARRSAGVIDDHAAAGALVLPAGFAGCMGPQTA